MAEARLDAMAEQQKKMKRELDRTNEFAKNLMVEQAKGEVKSPADKRAVGYLVEEQYDIKELVSALKEVVVDNKVLDVEGNQEKFKQVVEACLIVANKRERKNNKEREAYKIASRSPLGWLAEKYYRQGEIFEDDSDELWYEREELPKDKKLELLRGAEAQAKYALQFKFPPPAQLKPQTPLQCHGCWEFGHIRRNCPKKAGN